MSGFGNAIRMFHSYALVCISGKLQEVRDNLLLVRFSSFSGSLFQKKKKVSVVSLAGILEFTKAGS